jgi:hypothetical protein
MEAAWSVTVTVEGYPFSASASDEHEPAESLEARVFAGATR